MDRDRVLSVLSVVTRMVTSEIEDYGYHGARGRATPAESGGSRCWPTLGSTVSPAGSLSWSSVLPPCVLSVVRLAPPPSLSASS